MRSARKPNPFEKVPSDSPVAPPPEEEGQGVDALDAFLDSHLGEDEGIGDFTEPFQPPDTMSSYRQDRECVRKHRGHAVAGIPTLMGSSYRDGLLIPGNSVTVLLTVEALPLAFPSGWASYRSPEFNTPMRGAVIYWPWVDMKVPVDLDRTARRILELHRIHQMGKTIEVACFGGHGRTGTLLAVLAALHAGWPSVEAVSRFRAAYCPRAIESKEQEAFVRITTDFVRDLVKAQGMGC